MLNALTNVRFWGQSGHSPSAAYPNSIWVHAL